MISTLPDSTRAVEAATTRPIAPAPSVWRDLARELFEQDGLAVAFMHARNVITGTVIIAAGLYAADHGSPVHSPATWTVHFAGFVVAAAGALLLLLNLCDGLRSLSRSPRPKLLRGVMVLAYVGLSVRLVQVFMLFRLPLRSALGWSRAAGSSIPFDPPLEATCPRFAAASFAPMRSSC